MGISQIYDQGQTFASSVLDIEESQLLKAFSSAIATITAISLAANYPTLASINTSFNIGMKTTIKNIAAISLAANYPTYASVMHSLVNSYKNVLAVGMETEYEFEALAALKNAAANPQAAPAQTSTESAPTEAPKKEEAKKEESEEEDEDMGFGLFD